MANLHYADRAFCYNIRTGVWTEVLLPTVSGATKKVSSSCELPISGQVLFTEWGTGAVGLLRLNNGHTQDEAANTFGTSSTEINPVVTITTNFSAPAIGNTVEWQELHIFWEKNEVFTDISSPTTVTITFDYDWGQTSSQTETPTPTNDAYFSRVIIPREARRSTRLRVTIVHEATEVFGIEGIAMTYEEDGATESHL